MIKAARGTFDILPGSVRVWQAVERELRRVFESYAFSEIRTPVFEHTDLFVRGVGAETDIVSKEMYTFLDKDGETSLTLRPEGTAPVIRSFIENGLAAEARVLKLYYLGPMFRRERPQKGRTRQFHQAGVEVLSATDEPAIEAEVIEMLLLLFSRVGAGNIYTEVNSVGCGNCRPAFVERLAVRIRTMAERLCADCRRRGETNPLRVFDCKVPACQPAIAELPTIASGLCDECRGHFQRFRGYLDDRGIDHRVDERMVRGLDYYIRTAFEMKSDALGAQNTIAGGGRYDGLSEQLGGPAVRGFGFGMGLERLILSIQDPERIAGPAGPDFFLATIGGDAFRYATRLARRMREHDLCVDLDFDGRSLKSQMRLADRVGARNVIVIGENEVRSGLLTVRDMATRGERQVTADEMVSAAATARAEKDIERQ